MKRTDFLKQLEENRLLPIYLFLGDEKFFHRELVKRALDKLLPEEEQQFNYIKLSAGETEPEELMMHLETPPFFGSARVVYLDEFENAKVGMDETILKAISRLADGVYFWISSQKLDGRKKNHQEIQKRINIVECQKVSANDLPAWIKSLAQQEKLMLTPKQINIIGQRLGNDLERIKTELFKMKTFAGENSEIQDTDLDDLLPLEPEPNIFALIDAAAGRNPSMGLPRLAELLDAGEPELKILATLAKQFRNIAAALEGRRQGMNYKTLASFLGINPYVAEKSYLQSGRFTMAEIQKVISRLLWADYRIKTGQREPRLELELAIVEICR